MGFDVLRGLMDDKFIKIISLFMKHPEKKFYLSEVSKLSSVNAATTFRALNKLVEQRVITPTIIGKVRVYQFSRGERARLLSKLLKSEDVEVLDEFVEKIKMLPRIQTVLLDSRTGHSAKVIIVGDYLSMGRVEKIAKNFNEQKNFQINFVELTTQQYEKLKGLNTFNLDKKVLYKKSN